jgi:response regulator RpfG family c-di-GMP phosphodiesterase
MNGLLSGETPTAVDVLRVLLVDDEPDVLDFLAEVFRYHACVVSAAPTAEQALARLDPESVDLVVCDIKLPGLSGLDLLQAVARKRPGTPVVLITGLPSVESAACGTRYHAYDYLTKPVSVDDVRTLVQRVRRDRQHANPARVAEDLAGRQFQTQALVRLGQLALDGKDPARVLDQMLADISLSVLADAALIVRRESEGAFAHRSRGHGPVQERLPILLTAALPTLLGVDRPVALPIAPPDAPVTAVATILPAGSGTILFAVGRDARHGAFLPEDRAFLLVYARMAGLTLERLMVTERVEDQIQDTVWSLLRALEARDPALRGHAARVSLYAGEIARGLWLPEPQLDLTRRAGLLHDLGKLTVLDLVLHKPGPLTPDEYRLVQRYPVAGERMLRPLPTLAAEATIVRHHAERYDGTGYPDRLMGPGIPLPSRIIAVADAFDAMTSPRPYRAPRPLDEARGEILRQVERQFDPTVTDAFSAIPEGRLTEVSRFYRSPHEARVA